MRISELTVNLGIIVQLVVGEQEIEFASKVVETNSKGIFVTPYIHDGSPLELTIEVSSKVTCNVFTDSPIDKKRISWRNVELSTDNKSGRVLYFISTNGYNNMAKDADRRLHDRIPLYKDGQVFDAATGKNIKIIVRDISDVGVSFYVNPAYEPGGSQITVLFEDVINERRFNLKIGCNIVRSHMEGELMFYGCGLVGENRDFIVYSFLRRLLSKKVGNGNSGDSGDGSSVTGDGDSVGSSSDTQNTDNADNSPAAKYADGEESSSAAKNADGEESSSAAKNADGEESSSAVKGDDSVEGSSN